MNATFILKHNTSRDSIEARTKAELATAITAINPDVDAWRNVNVLTKAGLVTEAIATVSILAAAHAKAEAEAKAAHDAALAAEAANPVIGKIKDAFLASLVIEYENLNKVFTAFIERAKDGGDLASAIEWNAADVFDADAKRRELAGLIRFAKKEVEEPTRTIEEYLAVLEDEAAAYTERVLNCYIPHSTNPVANVKGEYELKAKAAMAKFLPRTVDGIRRDLAAGEVTYTRFSYFGR